VQASDGNSAGRAVLGWQGVSPINTEGFGRLNPPNKAPSPQLETWNTKNQCSFNQLLECQARSHKCKASRRNAKPYGKLSGDGSAGYIRWMQV